MLSVRNEGWARKRSPKAPSRTMRPAARWGANQAATVLCHCQGWTGRIAIRPASGPSSASLALSRARSPRSRAADRSWDAETESAAAATVSSLATATQNSLKLPPNSGA